MAKKLELREKEKKLRFVSIPTKEEDLPAARTVNNDDLPVQLKSEAFDQ